MKRVTRESEAGRAYLDLQNRARTERRGTQELLTLYVVERWLARLSASPHADKFVIKGGMLLAAYDARRPTADLDALARSIANGPDDIVRVVSEVAQIALDDGVEYLTSTLTSRVIRDQAIYSGLRIAMDYPLTRRTARSALRATAAYRGTPVQRLSEAIGDFAELRQQTFAAYRSSLGGAGLQLPADLPAVAGAVIAFADPLATDEPAEATWQPAERLWAKLPN